MYKTGEWIRLMSLLILSALLIGWVGYFGAKLTRSVEITPPKTYAETLKADIEQVLDSLLGSNKAQVTVQADVADTHEVVHLKQVNPKDIDHPYVYTAKDTTQTLNKKAIYRLSVTVMVDGVMTKTAHGQLYQPRSPREMEMVQVLVKNLMGFSKERGDSLEVLNVPFSAHQKWFGKLQLRPWLPTISLLFIMGISLFMLGRYVFPQFADLVKKRPEKYGYPVFSEKEIGGQLEMIRWMFKTQPVRALDVLSMWDVREETQNQAAMLLLALGEESMQQALKGLPETQVRRLAYLMGKISVVDNKKIDQVCRSFLEAFSGQGDVFGGKERLQPIFQRAFGSQKAEDLLKETEGAFLGKNVWEKLEHVPVVSLAHALEAEYPQTIALILYHLSPKKGAELLEYFPESLKMDVLMRLSSLKPIDTQTLALVEESLNEFLQSELCPVVAETGKEKVRTIFKAMNKDRGDNLLQTLYERSPELVQDLTTQFTTFDDCQYLSKEQVHFLLKTVDMKTLALALKGASDDTKDVFSKGMSVKDWMQLMKEMTKLGAVKLKDIDEAQQQIVKQLQTQGFKGERMNA